jgi:hypothetical protein
MPETSPTAKRHNPPLKYFPCGIGVGRRRYFFALWKTLWKNLEENVTKWKSFLTFVPKRESIQ